MSENTPLQSQLSPLQQFVESLAAQPILFDLLRWILEAGFRGEKRVLQQEGLLECDLRYAAPHHAGANAAALRYRVLDLGCGTGAIAPMFNPSCYLGVDPNPRYIEWAKKVHPGYRFLVMDGRNLTLESESFDAVVIGGVIHHLEDQDAKQILAEAKRVLKRQTGKLVMWEDVPTWRKLNWIGKLIQALDVGEYIRLEQQYLQLVRSTFSNVRHYPMSSGVCDYVAIVAESV